MIKEERLYSRTRGINTTAKLYEDNVAIISTNSGYVRCILNKDNTCLDAIDFDGGPFIEVGSHLFEKKIKSIKHCYIIELE